jgi:hypothetical protein
MLSRVDALDAILMNRVKENAAKEIEAAFKAKYAYTFDFSKTSSSGSVGTQFTRFTGTKVQILAQNRYVPRGEGPSGGSDILLLRRYLYFCISKASKLSIAILPENKAPQGDRIFADRIPETRLFDVQRMQINAGQASGSHRPASARILRPKDQTSTAPNAGTKISHLRY